MCAYVCVHIHTRYLSVFVCVCACYVLICISGHLCDPVYDTRSAARSFQFGMDNTPDGLSRFRGVRSIVSSRSLGSSNYWRMGEMSTDEEIKPEDSPHQQRTSWLVLEDEMRPRARNLSGTFKRKAGHKAQKEDMDGWTESRSDSNDQKMPLHHE